MRKIILAALAVATIAFSAPAEAARRHHQPTAQAGQLVPNNDGKWTFVLIAERSYKDPRAASRPDGHSVAAFPERRQAAGSSEASPKPRQADTGSGFSSSSLVTEARKYIGTNPTGRGSLWCGAFMDLVLKKTGHAGGGNLASAYARYGTRVPGPQVGAIAVMGRNGGGHVGVVTGIDRHGDPIILSGNTWNRKTGGRRTVAEGAYPRRRIYAYVIP